MTVTPVYHPAGHDSALRGVLEDLRTGRWLSMAQLLDDTADWSAWTRRTQVLAAVAAGSDVVQVWRAEQPHSPAAAVMHARVAVERALRAHREAHPRTGELWRLAWEACQAASHVAPGDPVPWVCLLALAVLDDGQRLDAHRVRPPGPMLPPGPWNLLAEADKRDPHNREAYHRMLQFLYARQPGSGSLPQAVNFVQWAAGSAPPGSALHVLPLYARVERYRRHRGQDRALDLHWVAEDASRDAERALLAWFDHTDPATESLLDLSHLAHALWGALRFDDAARVFTALGPYYTPQPWAYRTRDPGDRALAEELFTRARARCLHVPG
ncbi:hypothetical protein E2C00_02745 [Streptomyces sp. WAC05374]|uniref:hypothetical protein n=1 Tax=Streptomyces sp. WAC05374 TaxID=2487420 RepID=UPI000F8947DF|nr:hypothetical protein [Streptomyces sp. WAC05374]RST19241.1 hypothetical protein EF905_02275 [Streptomyces sp. WAC05374]TDF50426.1 hypothetical protein E2B92_02725 [Streptomyces sp. WAC05374]TDF51793.1 hypothetical protein E2C02_22910 [Streptomyces sp. WAC05374]TDF60680.1 hypothetical protein E2C00_02745 [Streptomyces sp. WAC05374]